MTDVLAPSTFKIKPELIDTMAMLLLMMAAADAKGISATTGGHGENKNNKDSDSWAVWKSEASEAVESISDGKLLS